MLAELLQVARNLTAQKIDIPLTHEDFGKPGLTGHATFKVVFDINGKIVKIETLLKQDEAGLWTLKKGKKRFFPCIRISDPLIKLEPDDSRWGTLAAGSPGDIREFLSSNRDSVQPVDLSGLCNEYVERISRWQPPKGAVFIDRIHNFAKAFSFFAKNPKDVSKAIVDAVEAKFRQHIPDEEMRMLLALLVGVRKESKKKGATVEYKIQLCLDFAPEDDLTFTLYQPRVSRSVLQCLNSEITPKSNIGICSLGGSGSLLRGSFPEWSVPPIISMPLSPFSKFSEAECNYRYGRADQEGFPVSAEIARGLVGALRQLTSDEFKGRTWCPLKSGKLEKKKDREDILIAYPSFAASELSVVKLISSQQHDEDEDSGSSRKRFADTAEPVIRSIKSRVAKSDLVEYLTLLLIRQISPGQIQLAYSAMPTIHEFGDAIQAWEMSGENLPANLCVPLPSKISSSGFRCLPPSLLFPEEVSRALSHQWVRDGTESTRLEGPSVGMVLDLFLRKPGVWQESAERLLELTLVRTEALLIGAGHILHRDDRTTFELWKKFIATAQSGKERRRPDYSLSQTISLIGSLLYAMNSTVQDYMNESAYLVGKLLAMMDELHRCYCVVVRDGDIPNALIGNGLLGRAAESPALALEELAERSRIYIGWAKSVGGADEKKKIAVHSARKILRLAQPLAERLHTDQLLEKELSAVGKAHLFLGYLSPVLGGDGNGTATGDDLVETKVDKTN
ncbi:MAG: hypothetical protein Q8L38_03130 [Pseudohongiella sp.]|nr:hypothetical protein [Pseudohongiella sp.]